MRRSDPGDEFTSAPTVDSLAAREPDRDQPLLSQGTLLGEVYEVGEILGSGGMGQVFAAVDHQLERDVAVKALWPVFAPSHLRAEGRALAALRHPGIVAVHAMGEHQGIPYLVMERLRGLSLGAHIAQRGVETPFGVRETIDILIGITDALTVLHREGFVHRDLKPDNVMLTPGRRTVLLDLGIALHQDQVVHERYLAGSPHYMAPECIANTDIGPAADVYSLGVVAFEMLTGRRPFAHQDHREILRMQTEAPAPRVSELVPTVPVHLDRLVHEMMQKDAADRPSSADVVGAWLRGIRNGRASEARAPLSVLIADDDPEMRALLSSFVRQVAPRAEIRLATDGHEALRAFRSRAPELALLDLDMPRMTGVELCMYLQGSAHAAQTAIVAISGAATEADKRLLHLLGVRRFVDKLGGPSKLFEGVATEIGAIVRTRSRLLG